MEMLSSNKVSPGKRKLKIILVPAERMHQPPGAISTMSNMRPVTDIDAAKNTRTSRNQSRPAPPIESGEILEQQIQHLLVATEHELRSSPDGIDELTLIRKLQSPPWQLIGNVKFHEPKKLYPVHFLLFHVLYRLRDTLAEAGENLIISPLKISIRHQDTIGGNGLPGALDSLRNFYLDLSQYELPEDAIQQMMESFWSGYQNSGPGTPETLAAAKTLGFTEIPSCFSETKKAFRRAVMQAHPDRGGDTEAIQELNGAFAVLKAHFHHVMEQI